MYKRQTWTLTIPAILAEGISDVIATVTDAADNTTVDMTAGELLIDITPPVIPVVVSQITNNTTPVISGTATVAAGESLSVTVGGITYTEVDGNLIINNGDDTWDLSIPVVLAEANYEVTASVTDAAGNVSTDISNLCLLYTSPSPRD